MKEQVSSPLLAALLLIGFHHRLIRALSRQMRLYNCS